MYISEFQPKFAYARTQIESGYEFIAKAKNYPNANISALKAQKFTLDAATEALNAAFSEITELVAENIEMKKLLGKQRAILHELTPSEKIALFDKLIKQLSKQLFLNPFYNAENESLREAKRRIIILRSNEQYKIY